MCYIIKIVYTGQKSVCHLIIQFLLFKKLYQIE